MPDANALAEHYQTLSDQDLLNLAREGGFTDPAKQVLHQEFARRNLTPHDVKRNAAEIERSNLRNEAAERGGGFRSPGLQLFGRSYLNESDRKANIQIRTKWFTISGIPLILIASYRFKCTASSGKGLPENIQQSIIDRVPLNWTHVFMTWFKTAILIIGVGLLMVGIAWFLASWRH